jgi:hypothetical protein
MSNYIWNGVKRFLLVESSGSKLILKKILATYYANRGLEIPEDNTSISTFAEEFLEAINTSLVSTDILSTGPFAVLVRDPINRFLFNCKKLDVSVEQALLNLNNPVFESLKNIGAIASNAQYFKFPEQLAECAIYLGVNPYFDLENIDLGSDLPNLTEQQEALVRQYYAEDINLYNSLNGENPEPEPDTPDWLAAGWQTPEGWRLAWKAEDVSMLTSMYVLAKRTQELGIDQPVIVIDMQGEIHTISFNEFEVLILSYGAARVQAILGDYNDL